MNINGGLPTVVEPWVPYEFYLPEDMDWLLYLDEYTFRRKYVSARPLPVFGPYRNVYVGITRKPYSQIGDVKG